MSNYNSSLALDCIASDPTSTTLYGITSGYSDTGTNVKSFLLVKSSPNPDHVSLGMWSMVSEEKSIPFSYWSPSFRSIDCSVSSKGVFTAFFNNGQLLTPGTISIPIGVRYDPETQVWTSIKTSPLYGWATDDWTHTSFNINNDGVESLVHMLTDADSTVIRFGVLNDAENVLQLASVWIQDRETGEYTSGGVLDTKPTDFSNYAEPYVGLGAFGKDRYSHQKKLIYANGRLYMMFYNHPAKATIESIPFTDPAAPPSTNRQTFQGFGNFSPKYFFTGTRGNVTFLGGLGNYNETGGGQEYSSFTMDLVEGIPQTPVVHTSPFYNHTTNKWSYEYGSSTTRTVSIHEDFVTVGGRLPGQNPFVVGLASEGIYEFSIVGVNGTTNLGLVEVIVPSPFTGLSHRALTLAEYIGQKNNVKVKPKLTGWEKFGVAVACLVGLFILVKYNNRRKAKNRAAAEAKHLRDQGLEMDRMRSAMAIEAAARTATTTAANTTMTIAYEDQIANLELSTHPRPGIVTSVGESYFAPPYDSDDAQAPEYSQHPSSNVVTSIRSGVQS